MRGPTRRRPSRDLDFRSLFLRVLIDPHDDGHFEVTVLEPSLASESPGTENASMSEHVGYVGLGNLGAHLAMSLLRAGHEVTVTDLHRPLANG